MDERESHKDAEDEVKLPEERIEDLEPEGEDEADVKGGTYAFKQGFPIKWTGGQP